MSAPITAVPVALERVLGEACPAAAVWVAPIDDAREVAVGRLAMVRSLPVVQRVEDIGRMLVQPDDSRARTVPRARAPTG